MKHVADQLQQGKTVTFKPKGNSMSPLIYSGDTVTVRPKLKDETFKIGDIVLCKVHGYIYLHKVLATGTLGMGSYLIGNNKGRTNGWTSTVYGLVISIVH